MTRKEKAVILNQYYKILQAEAVGVDKTDSKREVGNILNLLNLRKEMFETENKFIAYNENITGTSLQMYEMIFKDFSKYGSYINYNLEEIQDVYLDLKYEMTKEERDLHGARIKYIVDYGEEIDRLIST